MKVVTILTRRQLPYARVLADSLRVNHPEATFAALLFDLGPSEAPPSESFDVVGPDVLDLADDDFARMTVMYDELELAAALKPWVLGWVLDAGHDVALYLDPQTAVYASLAGPADAARRHGIGLAPQRLTPVPRDGLRPDEADLMRVGLHHLGLLAVSDAARPWLQFWRERLLTDCVIDLPEQLFRDGRWADWIPALYDHALCDDPGLAVGYWNADERAIELTAEGYRCRDLPLRLFHFGGFRPDRPWCLSRDVSDAPRVVVSEHPALGSLLSDYAGRLRAAGLHDGAADAYRYGRFADGAPVSRAVRTLYRSDLLSARRPREGHDEVEPPVPDYRDGFIRVRTWLTEPSTAMPRLSRVAYAIWASRADLQTVFPRPQEDNREGFAAWLRTFGVTEGLLGRELAAAGILPQVAPTPLAQALGCNVFGYLSSVLGVGATGRHVMEALRGAGVPLTLHVSTQSHSPKHVAVEATDAGLRYPINLVAINADMFEQWVDRWGSTFAPDAYTIGLWAWELETFPAWMYHALAHVDEIWALSEFNAQAFRSVTDRPVHVFPVPASPTPRHPRPALEGLDAGRDYFLFVFDYLSEVERKNPCGLIGAYREAFPGDDGPALVIKSLNGEQRRTERERVRSAASGHPGVFLIEEYLPAEQLHGLMQHALAFVSLHRSEGLGLGLMESMAQGTPVIATGYSGNLEFMNAENSLLIPYTLVPATESAGYYAGLGSWAEPDRAAAAAAMRRLAAAPEEARALGRRAQRDVLARFTRERAARFAGERADAALQALVASTRARVMRRRTAPLRRAARILRRAVGIPPTR